ncbi:Abi family protein [Bacillus sp. Bva_UNVM-123]|uniref:Abi family protein n=1 Tax=Bacillus sp. Bva_UNVM-123 TaxID=2829798 RepID=UPI00391F8D76
MSNQETTTVTLLPEGTEHFSSDVISEVDNPTIEPSPMKEFMSVEQIIEELKIKDEYPLSFNETEIVLAKEFFYSHNYFSFSIYRKLLPRIEGKLYCFSDCVRLYNFNTFIRDNLSYFIRDIELMLRATLIEYVCKFYEMKQAEVSAHEIPETLNDTLLFSHETGELYLDYGVYRHEKQKKIDDATEIMDKFTKTINESKSDAILHYKKKESRIPLWVLLEEVTYGDVYHFAQALDTDFLHYWIDNAYDKGYRKFMLGWFRCINFLRNDCAHYNRLYGRYFNVSTPKLLKEDTKKAGIAANDNDTLFAIMLTIKNVLAFHVSALQEWDQFIDALSAEIGQHADIVRLVKMGFPENWEECLHSQMYCDRKIVEDAMTKA